jgi:hypothetical protein
MWVEKTAAVVLKKEQYVRLKNQYPTTRLHGVTTKQNPSSLWKLCSRVSMFVISHFNIIVRILVTSSGKMEFRPHGWQITLHSPAITEITLSSAKLCLSLSAFVCFSVLWNETLLQWCNVFYASKKCLYFTQNKLMLLKYLCFYSGIS